MRLKKGIAPKATRVFAGLGLSMALACGDSNDSGSEHADEHSGSSSGTGGSGGKAQAGSTSSAGKGSSGGEANAGAGGKSTTGSAGEQATAGTGHAGDAGHGGSAAGKGGSGGTAAGSGGSTAGSGGAAAGSGGSTAPSGKAITIHFKAKVGAQDFACGHEYDGQGSVSTKVTPQDFRMFVQDLALIRMDESVVPVQLDVRAPWQSDKVALLDFENGSGGCQGGTTEMNAEITGHVPEGDYKGVSFSNGVPEEINHKDPTTQPDPLKTYANLSWGWLTGFRFSKLEMIQVVPSGQVFGMGLAHPGTTACTGSPQDNTVTCAKSNRNKIKLQPFDASSNKVSIDIGAAFKNTNLSEDAECHSSGSYCAPMFDALGINFADGKDKDGQTVFKVE